VLTFLNPIDHGIFLMQRSLYAFGSVSPCSVSCTDTREQLSLSVCPTRAHCLFNRKKGTKAIECGSVCASRCRACHPCPAVVVNRQSIEQSKSDPECPDSQYLQSRPISVIFKGTKKVASPAACRHTRSLYSSLLTEPRPILAVAWRL
jgi:hypothetical protein